MTETYKKVFCNMVNCGDDTYLTRIIRWHCEALLRKVGPGRENLAGFPQKHIIQVACVSLQCAITDVLLLPSLPPSPSSKCSLPPNGSLPLPDLLLCGDEGVVQRWGEDQGRGRGDWVKKWGVEVITFLMLTADLL